MAESKDFGPGHLATDDSRSDESPSTPSDHKKGNDASGSFHDEHATDRRASAATRQASVSALLRNPLAGMSEGEIMRDVDGFVESKGLQEHRETFRKGAMLARVTQRVDGFEYLTALSEEEKEVIRRETTSRWSQPFMLYFLVILCAGSAIVQGMDQTAVNGAQIFYFREFNITNEWQQGLLNGAPYLCSALIGCWTNAPLNKLLGRRGTIFVSCIISFITGLWMAAANTWYNLLIARFALGFAVGAKSSTTPVYAAECAPKTIRGALTMMWQMWTAFGSVKLRAKSSAKFKTCADISIRCIQDHVGFHGVRCLSECNCNWRTEFALALDVGFDIDSAILRHDTSVLVPRESAMV